MLFALKVYFIQYYYSYTSILVLSVSMCLFVSYFCHSVSYFKSLLTPYYTFFSLNSSCQPFCISAYLFFSISLSDWFGDLLLCQVLQCFWEVSQHLSFSKRWACLNKLVCHVPGKGGTKNSILLFPLMELYPPFYSTRVSFQRLGLHF